MKVKNWQIRWVVGVMIFVATILCTLGCGDGSSSNGAVPQANQQWAGQYRAVFSPYPSGATITTALFVDSDGSLMIGSAVLSSNSGSTINGKIDHPGQFAVTLNGQKLTGSLLLDDQSRVEGTMFAHGAAQAPNGDVAFVLELWIPKAGT